jgi:hypothetical protein
MPDDSIPVAPPSDPTVFEDQSMRLSILPRTGQVGRINFIVAGDSEPILALCPNGEIYVRGKLAETDKQVVEGIRAFVAGMHELRALGELRVILGAHPWEHVLDAARRVVSR